RIGPSGSRRPGRDLRWLAPGGKRARARNAHRRRDPARRRWVVRSRGKSADLRPDLIGALERVAFVQRRNRGEVEVALVVGREGEGQAVAVFGAVERDPVIIDGVGAALAKAAAFHLTVVQFHRGDRWKLVEFRVA